MDTYRSVAPYLDRLGDSTSLVSPKNSSNCSIFEKKTENKKKIENPSSKNFWLRRWSPTNNSLNKGPFT